MTVQEEGVEVVVVEVEVQKLVIQELTELVVHPESEMVPVCRQIYEVQGYY